MMKEKTKLKMSQAKLGKKNPRWNDGNSEYPEHYILKKNRIEALKKTQGKCSICGEKAYEIHHVDFSKENHGLNNLICLCKNCHIALHRSEGAFYGRPPILINGMTLKEIAQKTGLSYLTIYKFSKKCPCSKNTENKINKALGIQ